MGINSFVKSGFKASLSTFDAEDVAIAGITRKGVIDDVGMEMSINEGGDDNQRSLRITFPGNAYPTTPKSGKRLTCRGKTWQITQVTDGPACLMIEVVEPERRG